ncbi:hypothetical protein FAM21834_00355 [Lentilactobacillus parabuchneri]|jgi:hypothetical protein|uniref:Uncharacterized protein n=1 Tax=Lentilactobacillus parabuchneri TaxID=152331 RepID=A0A1X1FH74_9LACO|nr:hypothetical protein FAM21731_00379 [Lentilactobacillus parabuchneri]ORN03898.1 hypothetical protein FAM21823_00436 [Lentilactobacillus parabuchneri]ORN05798.1 hypothetical protein FAM21829_00238 [Lentilactobacillus parabuchneri]ORN10784.1 hypothetical protein FAM23163_00236 [Lentilactobacillus parabuchneri]ORN12011.1 hypothetical protein FAM21834_00355 [Lentilactobacillus parabuchneri]
MTLSESPLLDSFEEYHIESLHTMLAYADVHRAL